MICTHLRDEVIDRVWSTIATEGWDEPKLRAERFQRIGSSNVPALWGLRAAIKLANDIGMGRIQRRRRQLANYMLAEMMKRGAESWTSPDAALRCAIVTVNVPPMKQNGLGEVAVEDAQNSHPRRRTVETAPLHAVLPAEEGYRPFPAEVRRIQSTEGQILKSVFPCWHKATAASLSVPSRG